MAESHSARMAKFKIGDVVLGNKAYVDMILGDAYAHKTYYIGMVDENNKVNFYDGKVSVVSTVNE